MNRKATRVFLRGAFAALIISAVFAGSAGASPVWKFAGAELTGSETIVGGAEKSGMEISGMLTTCDNFLYNITIKNEAGVGKGSLTEVPLYNCYTDGICVVESIKAEALPWATNLTTITSKNYIIVKGVKVGIMYGDPEEECVLGGFLVTVKGEAGGLVDNTTESAQFDAASFEATKTKLEAAGSKVKWTGFFPTEAFQWHREQALTVS